MQEASRGWWSITDFPLFAASASVLIATHPLALLHILPPAVLVGGWGTNGTGIPIILEAEVVPSSMKNMTQPAECGASCTVERDDMAVGTLRAAENVGDTEDS